MVSASIKKLFSIDYVDIYLFSIFFYRSFPFENDFVNIHLFSIFFNRFCPVEKCGVVPHCLHFDSLTLRANLLIGFIKRFSAFKIWRCYFINSNFLFHPHLCFQQSSWKFINYCPLKHVTKRPFHADLAFTSSLDFFVFKKYQSRICSYHCLEKCYLHKKAWEGILKGNSQYFNTSWF